MAGAQRQVTRAVVSPAGMIQSESMVGGSLEQVFGKVSTQPLNADGRTVVSLITPDLA